jgi:hypothetical protein
MMSRRTNSFICPWICGTFFVLFFLLSSAFAHTIVEVVSSPTNFDQQSVQVVGLVANMVTRYGDSPYTTFDLVDAEGATVAVFTWGESKCRHGDLCKVSGTFVMEKTLSAHHLTNGVVAQAVEKLSEAEYKTAGPLFREKKKVKTGLVGRNLQGFTTIP